MSELTVGELIEILNKIPKEKRIVCIFEACNYPVLREDIIDKKYAVFINADQSPIDWNKVI